MRELVASVPIHHDPDTVWQLPGAMPRKDCHSDHPGLGRSLDDVAFQTLHGQAMTWGQSIAENYTDGIIVLHRGRVVYERYCDGFSLPMLHNAMSVTKSYVGTLAMMLVAESLIEQDRWVTDYLPELAGSAFAGATMRQLMDMTTALPHTEDYANPDADFWVYMRAGGWFGSPQPADPPTLAGYHAYLPTVGAAREDPGHGLAFGYKSVNTEVLGWVIARVMGLSLQQAWAERIWQPMGAEQDAVLLADVHGVGGAGAGLCAGLRDLARFGEVLRCEGCRGDRQVVAADVVATLFAGASPQAFAKAGYTSLPGWSYRSMWWVGPAQGTDRLGILAARGIHGQGLWIDPAHELVIARFASHPLASNVHNDPISLPAYRALAQALN